MTKYTANHASSGAPSWWSLSLANTWLRDRAWVAQIGRQAFLLGSLELELPFSLVLRSWVPSSTVLGILRCYFLWPCSFKIPFAFNLWSCYQIFQLSGREIPISLKLGTRIESWTQKLARHVVRLTCGVQCGVKMLLVFLRFTNAGSVAMREQATAIMWMLQG